MMGSATREHVHRLADYIEAAVPNDAVHDIHFGLLRSALMEVYFRRKERKYPTFKREKRPGYVPEHHAREEVH